MLALLYCFTRVSRTLLFWLAFILTRPLGATVGDLMDKPVDHGGFDLSRPAASVALAGAMLLLIVALERRARADIPSRHAK